MPSGESWPRTSTASREGANGGRTGRAPRGSPSFHCRSQAPQAGMARIHAAGRPRSAPGLPGLAELRPRGRPGGPAGSGQAAGRAAAQLLRGAGRAVRGGRLPVSPHVVTAPSPGGGREQREDVRAVPVHSQPRTSSTAHVHISLRIKDEKKLGVRANVGLPLLKGTFKEGTSFGCRQLHGGMNVTRPGYGDSAGLGCCCEAADIAMGLRVGEHRGVTAQLRSDSGLGSGTAGSAMRAAKAAEPGPRADKAALCRGPS